MHVPKFIYDRMRSEDWEAESGRMYVEAAKSYIKELSTNIFMAIALRIETVQSAVRISDRNSRDFIYGKYVLQPKSSFRAILWGNRISVIVICLLLLLSRVR
jgi:hypothetical protein